MIRMHPGLNSQRKYRGLPVSPIRQSVSVREMYARDFTNVPVPLNLSVLFVNIVCYIMATLSRCLQTSAPDEAGDQSADQLSNGARPRTHTQRDTTASRRPGDSCRW